MKKLFLLTFVMLLSVMASAQAIEFAYITGTNVNIRKSPSTTAPILMHDGEGIEIIFVWSTRAGGERSAFYLDKGEVVQILQKQPGWCKVRFYPYYGSTSNVTPGDAQHIDGWMSSKFLETASPVYLDWQNVGNVLTEYEGKVNDGRYQNTLLIQSSSDGYGWMLYGRLENGHMNVYGDAEAVAVEYEESRSTPALEKDGETLVLRFGNNYTQDNFFIEIDKMSPQLRDRVIDNIPSKPFSKRYYFPNRFAYETEGPEAYRCFEIWE